MHETPAPVSIILNFSCIKTCDMIQPSKEGTSMMEEYEFIILYLQASEEVKDQVEQALTEHQQRSEPGE